MHMLTTGENRLDCFAVRADTVVLDILVRNLGEATISNSRRVRRCF